MAGRRRKRQRASNDASYKPPLMFTESPVQGRKFHTTPVQAARRPFLAPSVPFDQLDASKWVSPQFERINCSSTHLEPSRRQRKGKRKNYKENETPVLTKSSMPALAFYQDTDTKEGNEKTSGNHSCNDRGTQRRSQRIQEQQKRTHFLFQKTDSQTPTKMREMEVLAYETPEHLMPQSRRTCPFQLWTKHDHYHYKGSTL